MFVERDLARGSTTFPVSPGVAHILYRRSPVETNCSTSFHLGADVCDAVAAVRGSAMPRWRRGSERHKDRERSVAFFTVAFSHSPCPVLPDTGDLEHGSHKLSVAAALSISRWDTM